MTNLNCSVSNCAHNQNSLCALDSINVGGKSALNPQGTCCESFVQKAPGACTNDCTCASTQSHIGCTAENCKSYSNAKCIAEAINVAGESTACNQGQTCCASFMNK